MDGAFGFFGGERNDDEYLQRDGDCDGAVFSGCGGLRAFESESDPEAVGGEETAEIVYGGGNSDGGGGCGALGEFGRF